MQQKGDGGGDGDVVHVGLERRESYSDFEMILESSQGRNWKVSGQNHGSMGLSVFFKV